MAVDVVWNSLPTPRALRNQVQYLMDRRGISPGRLAAMARRADPAIRIHQTTISRYLGGADLSYAYLHAVWNVLLSAQRLMPDQPLLDAMVPARRIVWAHPGMTREEFLGELVQHDIDYAPWGPVAGKATGVLDVRKAAPTVQRLAPGALLSGAVDANPLIVHSGKPHSYSERASVGEVRRDMLAAIQGNPARSIAFVRRGTRIVGLVAPFNFIGVQRDTADG